MSKPDSAIVASIEDLVALRQLGKSVRFPPRQAIRSLRAGNYLSAFRGRGMDFDDLREYQAGDDIRAIDWKVTARTSIPHTKLFREERERPVLFCLDFSASMFFGSRRVLKQVLAAQVCAMLAWSARFNGDRVGGLVFNQDSHKEIKPRNGDRGVYQLFGAIAEMQHAQRPSTLPSDTRSESSLSDALLRLQHIAKTGNQIFIISDFYQFNDSFAKQLNHISRHNEIMLLHISDALEYQLPNTHHLHISNGQQRVALAANDKDISRRHLSHFQQRCDTLTLTANQLRLNYLQFETHQTAEAISAQLGKVKR